MQTRIRRIIGGILILLLGGVGGYMVRAVGENDLPQLQGVRSIDTASNSLDYIQQLSVSETIEDRVIALCLGDAVARTDSGHRYLQDWLASHDSNKVLFSEAFLDAAADLSDVPRLMAAAKRHSNDEATVSKCIDRVIALLGKGSAEMPRDSSGDPGNLARLDSWLSDHKALWADKAYADYWGEELLFGLKAMRKAEDPEELLEYYAQTLYTFLLTKDAERAVPAIMRVLEEADPRTDSLVVGPLIYALQTYIGEINVHAADDIDGWLESHQSLLSWWNTQSAKSPSQWVISRLAQRGVKLDVDKSEDVLAWIDKTLQEGSTADREASLLLSYMFPPSMEVPFPKDIYLVDMERAEPTSDYLLQCRLAQTSYWRRISPALEWDKEHGRYIVTGVMATQARSRNADE